MLLATICLINILGMNGGRLEEILKDGAALDLCRRIDTLDNKFKTDLGAIVREGHSIGKSLHHEYAVALVVNRGDLAIFGEVETFTLV